MGIETRERLIKTAAALFHQQGYAATGVKQIIAASESGEGSFYHFFGSKEDLLMAVLDDYRRRLEEEILRPAARAKSPVARAFAILRFYRKFLKRTDCRLGCPIGNLAGELSDSNPRVRVKIGELFAVWKRGVASHLRAAFAATPGVNVAALATLFLSVMEGAVMQARVSRSLRPFDATVASLRHVVAYLQEAKEVRS